MKPGQRIALVGALAISAACGGGGTSSNGGGGPAEWTVMVYMAADNSLAVQGILDLDELENAGVDSRVDVVVQAEFSPDVLAQYQCDASCFNRNNFNTFRYAITQNGGSSRNGPDRGSVQDIGNVDMTDPAQLAAFVAWAKQNHPASHYLLVLWNHGGGYTGLIQDQTSAGSGLMSLADLKSALTTAGAVDVVDFDMCLMAGYETLVDLQGLADFAVFSEEVVPGEGNPYTEILNAMQANPTADGRAVSNIIVDQFQAFYTNNQDKSSTTLSAYDLAGFGTFDQALGNFAAALTAAIPGEGANIAQAAAVSQKYTISELTDVVNFLDSLDTHVSDAPLKAQIGTLRPLAVAAAFRVNNQRRNGSGSGPQPATDVSRSTGLHLVLPSGQNQDVFNASGTRSLAAYQALYPGRPWTTFLTAWVAGSSQIPTDVVDQGEGTRFEAYLVWDQQAIAADADVDLWILEPDGNIYIPAIGSVSPNGTLSNDSYADGVNFEGYLTNRVIQKGTYKFYANLWRDPNDHQPVYDLAYRLDQSGAFTFWLQDDLGQPPGVLSLAVSWLNDPTPTFGEVESGAYTDLQYVVNLSVAAPPAPSGLRRPGEMMASQAQPNAHQITPAQVETIRRLILARRADAGAVRARHFGQPMPFARGGR
ncbi:MAG TPA: clostripain-related cysteine peptidase [Gemmatimonadales bacterium]|jgi:hypothetical protein